MQCSGIYSLNGGSGRYCSCAMMLYGRGAEGTVLAGSVILVGGRAAGPRDWPRDGGGAAVRVAGLQR